MARQRIDLNSVDLDTLFLRSGIPPKKAEILLAHRPYWDFSDLAKLPGFGRKTLERLAAVAHVVPPPPLDVNRCTTRELTELPGIGTSLARRIVAERPYSSLADLERVPGIGKALLDTIELRAEALTPDVLDVNEATRSELQALPGLGQGRTRRILAVRPYDDLAHMAADLDLPARLQTRLEAVVSFSRTEQAPSRVQPDPNGNLPQEPPADYIPSGVIEETITPPQEPPADYIPGGVIEETIIPPQEAPVIRPTSPATGPLREQLDAEFISIDTLTENEWVFVEDDAPLEVDAQVALVPTAPMSITLVEHNAVLSRELTRRIPLFLTGWGLGAGVVLIGVSFLYAMSLVAFGPREDLVAAPTTLSTLLITPDVNLTVQAAIWATQAAQPNSTAQVAAQPTELLPTASTVTLELTDRPAAAYLSPLTNIGTQIFSELFAPGDFWELGESDIANIGIDLERLTIDMRTGGAIAWARNGFGGTDFHYQGTVFTEGCQSGDYYGLVFRSTDDLNLYLFGVSCSGQYRIVRRLDGKFSTLQDFTTDPNIQSGGRLNLLGVRAQESHLYFYVNDQYIFDLTESSITEGRFGVFAKSHLNPQLSVHFDDFAAWNILP